MVDLQALVWRCWEAALREARDAVVFLDDNAATTLRWNGGLKRVLKAGATKVKDFSAFESGEAKDSKALFITAEDLQSPTVISTLSSVLRASCFESCTVVSAMPIRPTPERTSQQEIQNLQRDLREWMGSLEDTVSKVLYIPLVVSCVLPRVAVLTPFTKLFPPLVAEDSPGQLPPDQRLMLDQIVATISALLDQFALRDQLFSLGKFAYSVADDLEQLPVTAKRRSALASETQKVSVIFVDRSLDVVLPLSFQNESFLDAMRSILPPFDATDVAINMSPVCHATCEQLSVGSYTVARGALSCLLQAKREELHNIKWKQLPTHLKEEFNSLTEWCGLTEQVQPDDNPLKFVQNNLKVFRKSKAYVDSAHKLVELVGITEVLSSPKLNHRYEKLAVEKNFMQNATGNILCGALDAGDALVQLTQVREKAHLSFTDLVGFIFYLHSLSGEELYIDQRSQETVRAELLNSLTDETIKDSDTWSPLAKILIPSLKGTETELQAAIAKVEQAASRISKQRVNLKQYRNILRKGDLTSPASYKNLLQELFDDMKMGIESSDLEEHSSRLDGIGMLKGGLGFLMNVKTARPNPVKDSKVVILVALGGITLAEIKRIEDVLEESDVQLLVITTSLLTPGETVCKVVSAVVA